MKIYEDILTKRHVETICDITHNDACATLKLNFGYGSNNDGMELNMDLSAGIADELLKLLEAKYGVDKIKSLMREYL